MPENHNRSILDATTEIVVAAISQCEKNYPDNAYATVIADLTEVIYKKLGSIIYKK